MAYVTEKKLSCKHCKINTTSGKLQKSRCRYYDDVQRHSGSRTAEILVFTDGSQMSKANRSLACGDVTRIKTIGQQVTSLASM